MSHDSTVILHIYGDNIVECERTLELIKQGFNLNESEINIELIKNNLISPNFVVTTPTRNYLIKFFPGTQKYRWNKDIYTDFILNKGGVISEGADAIVTRFDSEKEEILLGLEYSAALPAGNNAWQRSGRSYSFSLANVPYFYLCEFGGNELTSDREVRASRFPNPALILSYILNSLRNNIPNMLVYQQSPVASSEVISEFADLLDGEVNLANIIYSMITDSNKEDVFLKNLIEKNIQIMDNISKEHTDSKVNELIQKKFDDIDFEDVLKIVKEEKRSWKKKFSKKSYHSTVSKLFHSLSINGYGIFSKDLPFSLLPNEKKERFLKDLKNIYPENAIEEISNWLSSKGDIAVCYVNGFKPNGGDSRPDRGLVPFARMLIGEEIPILTIVFGPVPSYFYNKLDTDIEGVAKSNGLWSSVINFSDALFIDSKTLNEYEPKTYIIKPKKEESLQSILEDIVIDLYPQNIGENDVDTLIHFFFSHLLESVFESFCNPPGGDWSGISILSDNTEYRYVSLPRLSVDSKRPDHVYQFRHNNNSIMLAIESKETLNSLLRENEVGALMNKYLAGLLAKPANAKRDICELKWTEDNATLLNMYDYTSKSAVAFIPSSNSHLKLDSLDNTLLVTNSDLAIAAVFDVKNYCTLVYFYTKDKLLYDFLHENITSLEFNKESQFILIDPSTGTHINSKYKK